MTLYVVFIEHTEDHYERYVVWRCLRVVDQARSEHFDLFQSVDADDFKTRENIFCQS